ncbi:MAG TPA: flagellar motor switch protein FliN [Baekduia sp.]|nr:flagellar motor switch protein FliN [Baekduia sp.]
MTDVEFTPLPEPGAAGGISGEADLTRLTDVTVELTVEVGRTHMSLGETMSLGQGSVVTLDRLADKPVDLLVNGRPIARGEVVVIDEQFGLRITEVNGAERGSAAGAGAATAFEPQALGAGDASPAALSDAA